MFKTTLALAALAAVAADSTRERLESMFIDHMQKFELEFKDGKEFIHRLEIFIKEVESIEKHNSDKTQTFTRGLNQFSHMTHDEWKDYVKLGTTRPGFLRKHGNKVHGEPSVGNPASVDWVAAGAVTNVKNQGQCGSCWSFSTTGAIEGAFVINNKGSLTSFSEEQLVQCDTTCNGCNGGWMDDAFMWVQNNGGLVTEASYPYTSGQGVRGSCPSDGVGTPVSGSAPTGYTDVQSGSVSALESAVAQQPVSIAIQADQTAFQSYSGGVLTGTCGTSLDHGVLVVGYGTLNGQDYWKVKNSWGPTWGDNGYVLIEKSASNECGVLLAASYPTM